MSFNVWGSHAVLPKMPISTSVEKHGKENFLEGATKDCITICNGQKRDSPSLGDRATIYRHHG